MSNKTYPTANDRESLKKVNIIEEGRPKPVKTETGESFQARSSHATYAYGMSNMMNIRSPIDDHDEGKTKAIPGSYWSAPHNQPIYISVVSLFDEGKKKASSGSSQSFYDTHKQMEKKEREKNIKMVGQSSNYFCNICFDFKQSTDMFRRCKCNYPFCNDCISKHVATQIQQNVLEVNCPNPNCDMELKPEYLQPILPKEVIARWESAKYESSIALWQKVYCPFKDCSVLLVNDGDEGNFVTSCECPYCHRLFCAQCKVPWHAEMNCQEFQEMIRTKGEKDLDRKFLELANREMWQRCPKCSIYVQKQSGCEHMTCRCGCNFCYECGKDWKSGHLCSTIDGSRSPIYSPHRSPSYSPHLSPRYSPYRPSYSPLPYFSDHSRRPSYSPGYHRGRSYSPVSPYHSWTWDREVFPYSRSRSPYSRSPFSLRDRSYSPNDSFDDNRLRRSYSRSVTPVQRLTSRRSYSQSVSPRPRRSYSQRVSPRPRRSYSRSLSPSPQRSYSRSLSPIPRRSYSRRVSPRPRRSYSRSLSPRPQRSYSRSLSPSPRRSYSRSVSPRPRRSYSRSLSPRPRRSYSRSLFPRPRRNY